MGRELQISREVAGRSLVQSQLQLQADLLQVLKVHAAVQLDPVGVVAPSHHLALAARATRYAPAHYEAALRRKEIFELAAHERCAVPMEDFPFYRSLQLVTRQRMQADYEKERTTVHKVMSILAREGPKPASDFSSVSDFSAGPWGPRRRITAILEMLWRSGDIAVSYRNGSRKYYDLLENVVPEALRNLDVSEHDARLRRWERYLDCVTFTDVSDPYLGFERVQMGERRRFAQQLLRRGLMRSLSVKSVPSTYLARPDFEEKSAGVSTHQPLLIPPLDNLLWRRQRVAELWNFSYGWEIYKPPERRRVGPYGMPLVMNDRMAGQADVRFDRSSGCLTVRAAEILPGVARGEFQDALIKAGQRLARVVGASAVRAI